MPLGAEKATLMGAAGGSSLIKMYGMGGVNSGPDPVYNNTEIKIYEEATDTWALGPVLALGRAGNTAQAGAAWLADAAYKNGKFWMAYGFAGVTAPAEPSNQYYDSVNSTTGVIGSAPGPSRSLVGYWSMHDAIYCGNGRAYNQPQNQWYSYKVVQSQAYSNDAWTSRSSGPLAIYGEFFSCSFSSDTNVAYMLTGRNNPNSTGNSWGPDVANCYTYSQSADSYSGLNNAPSAQKARGAGWIDNTGEQAYCWFAEQQELKLWVKSTDSWTSKTGSGTVNRSNVTCAFSEGPGIGYYAGGEAQSPESPTGYTFLSGKYTTATDTWASITSESVGRIRAMGQYGGIFQ